MNKNIIAIVIIIAVIVLTGIVWKNPFKNETPIQIMDKLTQNDTTEVIDANVNKIDVNLNLDEDFKSIDEDLNSL